MKHAIRPGLLSQKRSFLLHAGDVLNFRSGATPKLNVKSAGVRFGYAWMRPVLGLRLWSG
jgi:hypothetical protein